MRKEKEIREELEGRRNSVKNFEYLIRVTKDPQFELPHLESQISIAILEWVLGEREIVEQSIMISGDKLKEGEK